MRRIVFLLFIVLHQANAADAIKLQIEVLQLYSVREGPKPFKEVGVFSLWRSQTKYAKGDCPDASDKDGKLTCQISCDKFDTELIGLKVRAPKNHRTVPYAPPLDQEFKVQGCTITGDAKPFVYRDPSRLTAELMQTTPTLAQFANFRPGKSVSETSISPLDPQSITKLGDFAMTPEGFVAVERLRAYTGDLALLASDADDRKKSEEFSKYSFAASNLLLSAYFKSESTSAANLKIAVTGNKDDFYGNLTKANEFLKAKPNKSLEDHSKLKAINEIRATSSANLPQLKWEGPIGNK
jgi:hypothetical protein